MSNEIALNNDLLAQLEADAKKFNANEQGSGISVPILKISTNKRCPEMFGKWVVGQTFEKDDKGGITGVVDPGKVVDRIVIIQAKNRYNRYVQTDTSKNCASTLFDMPDLMQGKAVFGWRYRNRCGKNTCQFHKGYAGNEKRNDACRCEFVLFCIAITKDGEEIPCMSYMGGVKYMPISDYLTASVSFRANGKVYKLPTFAYETILEPTELKSSGGVDYYVPYFKRGDVFGVSDAERFHKYREIAEKTIAEIEESNANMMKPKEDKPKTDGADPNYNPMLSIESRKETSVEDMGDLPNSYTVKGDAASDDVKKRLAEVDALLDGVPF